MSLAPGSLWCCRARLLAAATRHLLRATGPAAASDPHATVPAATGQVTTGYPVTVLDDGDGAELCLGGVMDSFPPQCGGPGLVGWDWSEHDGDFEEGSGVRWGDFVVTGSFDGETFTPSRSCPRPSSRSRRTPTTARASTPRARARRWRLGRRTRRARATRTSTR